jgi:hypothetical protein
MIVNCIAYQEGKRVAGIGTDEIGAWLVVRLRGAGRH